MCLLVRFGGKGLRSRSFTIAVPAVSILCISLLRTVLCSAQASTLIRIDASQPYRDPGPAGYDGGTAKSPTGGTITVNSRYLMRDGKPWLPVVGEFHYSRFPESRWEEELLKMKAAGVDVVAAYVIWIHHEEIEGQFEWGGRRDLRAFAQLCAKHGMYLEPRIGPWAHGETRNGGFPDWLLRKGPTRVNDPVYLSYVRKWYGQAAQQLKGLLWKDGGPVVGIQLENEYSNRGPGGGTDHILELKRLAIESGLDVPLYLVTGWDNAAVPERAVIPVYGGYPDAPWDASPAKLPPSEVYAFRFSSRVASNMGAIGGGGKPAAISSAQAPLPYFTAEIGGGIQDTYHRRPVIKPDDIAAMFPIMLGSGVNLYGTYMFQGGENPDGRLSTLQESQATGYPNDVPVKSYDFQAPLGEFGEERESLRKMKVFQYFLNDFGDDLAPMTVHAPDRMPANPGDFSVARVAVRSRGDSGYIFLNNYVRNYSMPARAGVQFEISLPHGVLRVPRRPIDVPSGSYFIWPFNLRTGGITIRYSTAQLFTSMNSGDRQTLYFVAAPGIPAEIALDSASVQSVKTSSGEIEHNSGMTVVSSIQPGIESSIDVVAPGGKTTRLVVLTQREAEDAWKVRLGDSQDRHLLITEHDFFADSEARPECVHLRSRGTSKFAFSVTPAVTESLQGSLPVTRTGTNDRITRFTAEAPEHKPALEVREAQEAGDAPRIAMGPAPAWRERGVAQAPTEAAWARAARWSITPAPQALDGLSDLYLDIAYQGDIARLNSGKELLTDNFYNGQPWSIGLRRYLDTGKSSFDLSVLPLRRDAPVYLELDKSPTFAPNGQAVILTDVRLVPEYELVLTGCKH